MKIYRIIEYDIKGRELSREHFYTEDEINNRMMERASYQHGEVTIDIITEPWELNFSQNYLEIDKLKSFNEQLINTLKEVQKLIKDRVLKLCEKL